MCDPAVKGPAEPPNIGASRPSDRRHAWTLSLLACIALPLAGAGCGESPEAQPRVERVVWAIDLMHAPSESESNGLWDAGHPTLISFLQRIEEAKEDETVAGLFLRMGSFGSAWGRSEDLGEALVGFRASGKPVHCHLQSIDNAGYALAAQSCDRISIAPGGTLNLVGVAAEMYYLRDLLDSIGVGADILRAGRYKGAFEPLLRREMSDETREAMGALLDDVHARLLSRIQEGREFEDLPAVQILVDAGPYDSGGALTARLVDDISYEDEARTHARRDVDALRIVDVGAEPSNRPVSIEQLFGLLSGEPPPGVPTGPRLALVQLDGSIVDERSTGPGGGRSGPFIRELRRIEEEDEIKAVVLRINSPGGSALASDRMWHAVSRLSARKPVFVSLGDVAASGGYYIAVAGNRIFAHPSTTLGSIGVIGGKAQLSRLLERLGVAPQVMRRGRNAAYGSIARGFSERERQVLTRSMQTTYDRFLRRVVAGRPLSRPEVEAIAQGRVWSGEAGRTRGLIDEVGGLAATLSAARAEVGLNAEAPLEIWPRKEGLLEILSGLLGGGQQNATMTFLQSPGLLPPPLLRAAQLFDNLNSGESVVLSLPQVFELR